MSEKCLLIDWITRSEREEIFREDISQYTDTMIFGRRMWSRCVLICDSTEVTTTFSLLSTCWVNTPSLKVKSGNKVTAKIIRDDIRKICILIEERNFTIRMWTETLEETQYQPLFYVFRNKGVGRFNRTLKTTCENNLHTMEITNGSTSSRRHVASRDL